MVIMTEPGATGNGCHGSIFAVVPDFPDAAEYRVIYTRTDAGAREYPVTFNRHYRGKMQFSKFPTWSPGAGKIAGLLGTGSADGPGDDCANIRASYESRFAIKSAVVVRYTPDRPRAGAAAVELRSVAIPPAMHGTTGKDGCAVNIFFTVPKVKGAVEYRFKLTDAITGVTRTNVYVINPGKLKKAAAGTPAYKSTTRLGQFYATKHVGGWGCTNAEWKVASAIKSVSFTARKK